MVRSRNIFQIEKNIMGTIDIDSLKHLLNRYKECRDELIKYGHYIVRPRCEYSLKEIEYGIKLIKNKINILKLDK